jgi:hypothetical protein
VHQLDVGLALSLPEPDDQVFSFWAYSIQLDGEGGERREKREEGGMEGGSASA